MRFFIAFCLVALLNIVSAMPVDAAPRLFGSSESSSSSLRSFPKWTGSLTRYFNTQNIPQGNCHDTSFNQCHLAMWQDFINYIRPLSTIDKVNLTNMYMNQARYITDIVNWGTSDYWAIPYEFFVRHGDCEDYAIAKFMTLRAAGFSQDNMRIVVLNDENLRIMHAVLAVYVGEEIYILDNQIKRMVSHRSIHHYTPIYSINETRWWRHR